MTASPGYMTPFPVGSPVAIAIQAGGGLGVVQTIAPGGQPQMVFVPVSGGLGTQSQLVQSVTSGAMATANQPQQVEMRQSSRQGGYVRLIYEQVRA